MSAKSPIDPTATRSDSVIALSSYLWSVCCLNRMKLIIIGVVVGGLSVVLVLALPNVYTATTTVLPASANSQNFNLISQIAGMAGLNAGGAVESYLQLYPPIVRSRRVANKVFGMEYQGEQVSHKIAGLHVNEIMSEVENERAYRGFVGSLSAQADLRLGLFTLSYSNTDPEFAAFVVNELTKELDLVFREQSGSDARKRRQMLEARVTDVADSLGNAEDGLKLFRVENQAIQMSPGLLLKAARLQRDVDINSSVLIELARQVELAKLEEWDSGMTLNVLDRANPPLIKSGPRRAIICMMSFVAAQAIAILIFVARAARAARSASRQSHAAVIQ
jgi:uncharacterized protein involved in exopolysaccharide biosynthesis